MEQEDPRRRPTTQSYSSSSPTPFLKNDRDSDSSDDEDDNITNELLQLRKLESALRKEIEESEEMLNPPRIIPPNKSLIDDESDSEEESLTLEEKIKWDDEFEHTSSPYPLRTLYDNWEEKIEALKSDDGYPTVSLPLSQTMRQRCDDNPALRARLKQANREYLTPPPNTNLQQIFIGLATPSSTDAVLLRSVYIRIRPDVLCGSVMDTISHSLTDTFGAYTIKRQGNHYVAVTPPWSYQQLYVPYQEDGEEQEERIYPPLKIDAQLVTRKLSRECERILLLQFYSISSKKEQEEDEEEEIPPLRILPYEEQDMMIPEDELPQITTLFRYHKTRSKATPPTEIHPSSSSTVMNLLSSPIKLLFQQHDDTTHLDRTFPSTSESFRACIQSAWKILNVMTEDLESRDLTFVSLGILAFCAFPSLPTLDVQYTNQLRLHCREIMILHILKVSSDLESYARDVENDVRRTVESSLLPVLDLYELEEPVVKEALPLHAYPLQFTPPESTCSPWGPKVQKVLSQISISSVDTSCSFDKAEQAIHLLCLAFQSQDDEEMQARIQRKNLQVMDRIAKMQHYIRDCIFVMRDAYGSSAKATKAADDFFSKAIHATKYPSTLILEPPQIPLLKCNIILMDSITSSLTTSTGTCYITYDTVLVLENSTTLMRVFSSNCKGWIYDLKQVVCEEKMSRGEQDLPQDDGEHASCTTTPTAMGISLKICDKDKSVTSFVPAIGHVKFLKFVEMLKNVVNANVEEI